jgi:hypothetical protein
MRLKKSGAKSEENERSERSQRAQASEGHRVHVLQSQPPSVQRNQRSLRVLLQSEDRLLGKALGLGDGR